MYWKGDAELLEDRAYDYGCNSGTPLRDAVDSLKKTSSAYGTVYYLNRDALSKLLKCEDRAG